MNRFWIHILTLTLSLWASSSAFADPRETKDALLALDSIAQGNSSWQLEAAVMNAYISKPSAAERLKLEEKILATLKTQAPLKRSYWATLNWIILSFTMTLT